MNHELPVQSARHFILQTNHFPVHFRHLRIAYFYFHVFGYGRGQTQTFYRSSAVMVWPIGQVPRLHGRKHHLVMSYPQDFELLIVTTQSRNRYLETLDLSLRILCNHTADTRKPRTNYEVIQLNPIGRGLICID